MMRHLFKFPGISLSEPLIFGFFFWLVFTSDGCKDNILKWCDWVSGVHKAAKNASDTWEKCPCLQAGERSLWAEISTTGVICQDWWLVTPFAFFKTSCRSKSYFTLDKYGLLALSLYADDLIPTRNLNHLIIWCKKELASEFEMKAISQLHYFFGLKVWQAAGEFFLGQGKYALEFWKYFMG